MIYRGIRGVAFALGWIGVLVLAVAGVAALVAPPDALHIEAGELRAISTLAFGAWLVALVGSLGIMLVRYVRYRLADIPVPVLLQRDIVSKLGLALLPTLVILARLVAANGSQAALSPLATWLPWIVWTELPPILGMGTFLYFEVFVIERRREPPIELGAHQMIRYE